VRYIIAEVATMFLAPYLFCKLKLAQRLLSDISTSVST